MRLEFFRRRILVLAFVVSLLFIAGGFIWALVALWGVSPVLIIHFTAGVGINEVGTPWLLGAVAVLALGAVCVNFLIAMELEKRGWFLSTLVTAVTVLFSVLIFAYFWSIIFVNYL